LSFGSAQSWLLTPKLVNAFGESPIGIRSGFCEKRFKKEKKIAVKR
jgi:hypothetical protein